LRQLGSSLLFRYLTKTSFSILRKRFHTLTTTSVFALKLIWVLVLRLIWWIECRVRGHRLRLTIKGGFTILDLPAWIILPIKLLRRWCLLHVCVVLLNQRVQGTWHRHWIWLQLNV
jgi:hypothetical protein